MNSATMTEPNLESVETLLRDELAQGDAMLATATPILRHLLANEDQALFSDEVVARVRGMLSDVARQMLHAQADVGKISDRVAFLTEREEGLADALCQEPAFLGHVHALTLEAQLALRMQSRSNIDPVLSPLLQEMVAAKDEVVAAAAMAALAAQARFIQHYRRMSLPIGDLPGDLFHMALLLFRSHAGDREDAAVAERTLRESFDESRGRLALISRLVMRLGKDAQRALDVCHAGLPMFATALSLASGQERDLTVLSFSDRQFARLALAMRAAGLKQSAIEEQFVYLHPAVSLPEGLDLLSAERAAYLLPTSGPNGGG